MRGVFAGAFDGLVCCAIFLALFFRQPSGPPSLPLFPSSVQGWSGLIGDTAKENGLDPVLVAVVMTIESCGDRSAGSSSGAAGLFQVMPFHFERGEDPFDPVTNAEKGMRILRQGLDATDGDVALALAWYNGGPGLIGRPQSYWPSETQRYVKIGMGLYEAASLGDEAAFDAVILDNYAQGYCGDSWGGSGRRAIVNDCTVPPAPYDFLLSPGPVYSEGWIKSQDIHGCEYGHAAIDLVAPAYDRMAYSPITGTVTQNGLDGMGNPVLVIENDYYSVTLLHGRWSPEVGDYLRRGEPVGMESNLGNTYSTSVYSDGSHTHISIYDKRAEGLVDPLAFMKN